MNNSVNEQAAPIPPFWVQAATSTVRSARGGRWLVGVCVLCSVYCLPWPVLLGQVEQPWYLAPDWSWFVVMLAMTAWYAIAVRWMNRHRAWPG
jgi:hypothetical protein